MTLTSDLVSRFSIESDAYPIFFEVGFSNLVCECIFGKAECHVPFSCHCDLDLVFRIIMYGAYLLYFLR